MPWEKPQIEKSETISLLKQATALVGPVVSMGITVLEAVKAFVEALLSFMIITTDPMSAALQAAINAARKILKDLTEGAGCYFLALPIRDVDLEGGSPLLETLGAKKTTGSGGNPGFIEELSASLSDPGDVLRPQFDEDAFVAGVIFLYGSTSYIEIAQLIRQLVWLFTGGKPSGIGDVLDDMRMPIPRSLSAQFVPKTISRVEQIENRLTMDDTPSHPYAVKLKWQPIEPEFSLFNKIRFGVRETVVMRAEKPLLKMSQSEQQKCVLKKFSGLRNLFYDDTIELNKKYYYAVGCLFDEFDTEGNVVKEHQFPFHVSQIMVSVPEKFPALPSRGIPPDWMMSPSPLAYFPPVLDFVEKVNRFLDVLEEGNKNVGDNINKYVLFLEREIVRLINWIEEILYTVQAIVEALDWPDLYVGMLPFAGKGGNSFMLSTLAQSLTDTGDPNRPPFDRGDEYVGGFVVYAGSETVGEAEKFWDLVKPLFGVQLPEAAENSQKQAHDAIDYASGEVDRQIQILDDLSASFGEPPAAPPVGEAIGPDLSPSFEDGTAENKPRVITFNDNLEPKTKEEEF